MMRKRWLALAALGCAAAAIMAYEAATRPVAIPVAAVSTSAPPPPPNKARFAPPARTEFDAIVDRPALAPSRRPPSATVPKPPPPPPPPDLMLTGIAVANDVRRAVIRSRTGAEQLVSIGDEIDGWRVVEIETRSITLERGGRRFAAGFSDEPAATRNAAAPPAASSKPSSGPSAGPGSGAGSDMGEMIDE